ncbi:uncharacterized protein AAG666_016395 [Megaptera novaeangliae]
MKRARCLVTRIRQNCPPSSLARERLPAGLRGCGEDCGQPGSERWLLHTLEILLVLFQTTAIKQYHSKAETLQIQDDAVIGAGALVPRSFHPVASREDIHNYPEMKSQSSETLNDACRVTSESQSNGILVTMLPPSEHLWEALAVASIINC